MVLVDTSIWVSHLRDGHAGLAGLLNDARVMCHPFIIGEIACGNLRDRSEVLSLLKKLPQSVQVKHEEVLFFIEEQGQMGKGLGYIDMCLSASAKISGIPIWTLDKRFDQINKKLGLNYSPPG